MRYILVLLLLLPACITSPKTIVTAPDGTVTETGRSFALFQMQTREGASNAYSERVTGFRLRLPNPASPGESVIELTLGYVAQSRTLVESKDDGSLPSVLIDTAIDPFNKGGLTDTVATGEASMVIHHEDQSSDNVILKALEGAVIGGDVE